LRKILKIIFQVKDIETHTIRVILEQ